MIRLPIDQFEAGRQFVRQHGRELERCRLRQYFRRDGKAAFERALDRYAHSELGYTADIFPDQDASSISLEASLKALQLLAEAGLDDQSPAFQRGRQHVLAEFDPGIGWSRDGADNRLDVGHGQDLDYLDGRGQLRRYDSAISLTATSMLASRPKTEQIFEQAFLQATDYLLWTADPLPDASLAAAMHLFEQASWLFDDTARRLLEERARSTISPQPTDWPPGSLFRPHDFLSNRDSVLMSIVAEPVKLSLEALISQQHRLGYWEAYWIPGASESKEQLARRRAERTVEVLIALDRFDHLEPRPRPH
jgi:hypothetical protein